MSSANPLTRSFSSEPSPVQSVVLQKLAKMRRDVGPAQQKVIAYVLEHAQEVLHQSISEVAVASGTSEATIVRLIRELGYRGYQEFKIKLSQTLVPFGATLNHDLSADDPPLAVLNSIFSLSLETLQSTRQIADPAALERAVALLAAAKRIEFYGAGGSGVVAQDGYHKFIRLGIPVNAVSDGHDAAQVCAVLAPGDAVVLISHSGATRDVLEAAELARASGAKVIAITRYGRSPLQKLADVVLHTLSPETAYRSEAMASRMAQLALIDTLMVALYLRRQPGSSDLLGRARRALEGKRL